MNTTQHLKSFRFWDSGSKINVQYLQVSVYKPHNTYSYLELKMKRNFASEHFNLVKTSEALIHS